MDDGLEPIGAFPDDAYASTESRRKADTPLALPREAYFFTVLRHTLVPVVFMRSRAIFPLDINRLRRESVVM